MDLLAPDLPVAGGSARMRCPAHSSSRNCVGVRSEVMTATGACNKDSRDDHGDGVRASVTRS